MPINPINFLVSLAAAMAAAAPSPPTVTVGTNLFVNNVLEAMAAATYSVLRIYPGPPPEEMWRIDNISIQAQATSKNASAATTLAWQLYESLHTTQPDTQESIPQNDWDIPGKMIDPTSGAVVDDDSTDWTVCLIVFAQPPGLIGVDESGRQQVVFNFNARFAPVPTS